MQKVANYLLCEGVPHLLSKNLDRSVISRDIVLNVCPLTLSLLPSFHGVEHYFTVMNTIRLITNGLLWKRFSGGSRGRPIFTSGDPDQLSPGSRSDVTGDNNLIVVNKSNVIDERLWVYWTISQNATVINGYFIFEFDTPGDKIISHTIDNIEYTHRDRKQPQIFNRTKFI